MIDYSYAYIFGCLILLAAWLLLFFLRSDLRREMWWATLIGLPFGLIDYFLVPNYWHPASLFNLMKIYRVGIESFVFVALMAGISGVIYQFLFDRLLSKIPDQKRIKFWPQVLALIIFILLSLAFPSRAVYFLMVAGFVGSIIIAFYRHDLIKQILFSAVIFSLFYWLVFYLVILAFPDLVIKFYTVSNLWGIFLVGVPLEEIVVAFCLGGFWSVTYESIRGFRDIARI